MEWEQKRAVVAFSLYFSTIIYDFNLDRLLFGYFANILLHRKYLVLVTFSDFPLNLGEEKLLHDLFKF